MMTTKDILEFLTRAAAVLHENKAYLTELDSAIGDADHGTNMDRGFQAILAKLPGYGELDAGAILKNAGMTVVSTVGGASGPLYGTAFMQAGKALAGKNEFGLEDILKALDAGLDGIKMRGKATEGEKTMIDAIAPALKTLHAAVAGGTGIVEAMKRASASADEGMKGTIPMLATKGRASYLGERSIGHQDPGATSVSLMFHIMADIAHE